jgi:hypothetical protein
MASKLVVKPFEHDFFYNDVFDKFSQVNKENNKLTQWKFPWKNDLFDQTWGWKLCLKDKRIHTKTLSK